MQSLALQLDRSLVFDYLRVGAVSGVNTQARPPQPSDFGGNSDHAPIIINTQSGECSIFVNGTIAPLNTVNVKYFGAKGNGVSDDTDYIRAAADWVFGLGGGVVQFPAGTYMVRDSIYLKDNVHYVGAGRGATIIKLLNNTSFGSAFGIFMPYSPGAFPAVGYWTKNNSISHLSVDGNKANNTGTYEGIALYQVKNCLVFDCEAYNCRECGFQGQVSNSGTDQRSLITFLACVAHDNLADGFQVGGAVVANCLGYSNGSGGIVSVGNFGGSAANDVETIIIGCRAEYNSGSGIGALWQLGPHIHTIISGCSARHNSGHGIAAIMNYTSVTNCVGEFNTLSGMYAQGDYISITGGMSRNNSQNGISIPFATNYLAIRGVTITDDQAVKTQGYPIVIGQPGLGSHNVIANCIISGNTQTIIYQATSASDYQILNNEGYNPTGAFGGPVAPVNPAVPASTVNQTNTFAYPCRVFIAGGTVTVIKINNVATGLTSGSFVVGPNETISITYTVAPTWQWFGL